MNESSAFVFIVHRLHFFLYLGKPNVPWPGAVNLSLSITGGKKNFKKVIGAVYLKFEI